MDQLRAMRVFCRVIDEGGFAKAARALDVAPAVITRLLAELEEHLGARLINRTTRRLALTDIGENYLERVRQILTEIDEAEALASSALTDPRGHLRVLVPPAIAVHQLAKLMPRFHALYPQITVELTAPGAVETVDENYDVSILSVRHALTGEFIARRLARSEVVLCASPEYLDRRGRPSHPREFEQHDVLVPPVSALQRGVTFHTVGRGDDHSGGESFTAPVRPHSVLSSTHIDTVYAAALHGMGIAGLPSYVAEDALLENALERVLPQWHLYSMTLWAGMPTRKHVPARTRVFVDYLVGVFGGEDRDPWLTAAGCETLRIAA